MDGNELRERRQALGLTQYALAKRLGRSESTIKRWEEGAIAIEAPETLDLALRALEQERRRG